MTAQEIFDCSVNGLRKQWRKSTSFVDYTCLYRGPHGRKCGVGMVITDDEYSPDMEKSGVMALKGSGLLPARLSKHIKLLVALQQVHDAYPVSDWERRWVNVAEDFKLKYTAPAK